MFINLKLKIKFQPTQFQFKEGSLLNTFMKFGIKFVGDFIIYYPQSERGVKTKSHRNLRNTLPKEKQVLSQFTVMTAGQ